MSDTSRDQILNRLHAALGERPQVIPEPAELTLASLDRSQKIDKLKTLMEAMRTEVHVIDDQDWTTHLKDLLKKRDLKTLLYAPGTPVGDRLQAKWEGASDELPELVTYGGQIEDFKEQLFGIDAAVTSTVGGIAEIGAVILWPDEKEPRLMSLVPPIHIAVLQAEKIYTTFSEAIEAEDWAQKMPTNVVLISGPSKTADIELTLAFGVHGPKELIVLILHENR
ncbi:MAG: lactate utilization protein [Desulfobacterales bacterium]|jgi:L-lactate dehydrogenase complex protein LldG